ncbi:dienelactone hydrolase family protein [Gracilimonas tropica]|uniref:carboxylesterase family protein n=1 Tax=Gracilimonas tropica TaxID=454600 RepID=UPI000382EE6A|nr:dienelactone hydrolase family protein [Gracilimonas tropica]
MKLSALTTPFFWILFTATLMAQNESSLRHKFEYHTFQQGGDTLNYRLFSPDLKEGEKYPLILFLHGAGERGDDNERQLTNGIWNFVRDDILEKYPAFIVAPQAGAEERWSVIRWDGSLDQTWSDSMTSVLNQTDLLVNSLMQELPVDTSRFYVTGLSMGGFGTWEYIQRFPEKVAAAVPVCGGGDLSKANRISEIPIWAFHGALDDVVEPEFSREMIDALRAEGGKPGYTEYPDVTHGSWVRAYADQHMISWLFDQKREKEPVTSD